MNFVDAIPESVWRVGRRLPAPAKRSINGVLDYLSKFPYLGSGRYCPVCSTPASAFGKYGIRPRRNAQCLNCGALERHRVLWLYLHRKTALFDGRSKKVLHVAPEAAFVPHFERRFGEDYLTADLYNTSAKLMMDITNIQFADNTFDFILCSHVLEHVIDDRRAMREFYRTLKPDGFAILLVPVLMNEATIESASIVDPAERLAHFHQTDHVRIYGRDYVERLREAGFNVKLTVTTDFVGKNEIKLMALQPGEKIFHCTKA